MNKPLNTGQRNKLIISLAAVGVINAEKLRDCKEFNQEVVAAIIDFLKSPPKPTWVNIVHDALRLICPNNIAPYLNYDGIIDDRTRHAFAWILENNETQNSQHGIY